MKKILIDGHNLIPKIPGLSLKDPEDEEKLIAILQEYCRTSRCQAEVFFDGAPLGFQSKLKHGLVRVHSVRIGRTADDAIISFLRSAGKNSRDFIVVTSDRRVQVEAKSLDSEIISSESFSHEIQNTANKSQAENSKKEVVLSSEEVEEWTRLFTNKKK